MVNVVVGEGVAAAVHGQDADAGVMDLAEVVEVIVGDTVVAGAAGQGRAGRAAAELDAASRAVGDFIGDDAVVLITLAEFQSVAAQILERASLDEAMAGAGEDDGTGHAGGCLGIATVFGRKFQAHVFTSGRESGGPKTRGFREHGILSRRVSIRYILHDRVPLQLDCVHPASENGNASPDVPRGVGRHRHPGNLQEPRPAEPGRDFAFRV